MRLNKIIELWTKKTNTYNLQYIILNKIKNFFEELNDSKSTHLNKLDNYWCYSNITNELILYNLIINKKKINNYLKISKTLDKLKIYKYKYIQFNIVTKKINNDLFNFKLKDKTYYLTNFTIEEKIINNSKNILSDKKLQYNKKKSFLEYKNKLLIKKKKIISKKKKKYY